VCFRYLNFVPKDLSFWVFLPQKGAAEKNFAIYYAYLDAQFSVESVPAAGAPMAVIHYFPAKAANLFQAIP
jgi:hypothetical protein